MRRTVTFRGFESLSLSQLEKLGESMAVLGFAFLCGLFTMYCLFMGIYSWDTWGTYNLGGVLTTLYNKIICLLWVSTVPALGWLRYRKLSNNNKDCNVIENILETYLVLYGTILIILGIVYRGNADNCSESLLVSIGLGELYCF